MHMFFVLNLILYLSSCHTTARWFSSDLKDENSSRPAKIELEDIEELKPKILSLQLQYGVFSPSKSMYSMTHNMHCFRDGALQACYLRLILPYAPFLSESVQLSRDLTSKIFEISYRERPDIKSERQIFADLVCDYMNNSLPPFDKSTVFCRIFDARKINELIITEAFSQKLSRILEERSQSASELKHMKIQCDGEQTFKCSLTPVSVNENPAQVVNTSIVLPDQIGGELSKEVSRGYLQKWSVQSGKNKVDIPNVRSVEGTLKCSSLAVLIKAKKRCLVQF